MRALGAALSALLLAACAGNPQSFDGSSAAVLATQNAVQAEAAQAARTRRPIDVDRETVTSVANNSTDIWTRIRAGFQMPDLDNDLVQTQVTWYTTRPDYVQRMTDRSRLYLYHIVDELEQRHMPTELALLPFIESAYNPQANSVAKAAGMWQFVPGTGRTYNLKQNMFQDERRDVLASTSAALDYLSRLHDMFGDWQLALAAYNWGEGNVQKAIARNAAQGLPGDYASLRMPNETRNYVPKLQAVKDIIADPAKYGLALPDIPNHPYFITVTTSRDVDVKVAAQLADLSLDQFRALNPSFTKPVILGATAPQILLPFDNAESFEHNLKTYGQPLSSWTTYTVSTSERPAALAAKIGVDQATLLSVNKIPAGMRLKPGSTVLVPKSENGQDEDISADLAESAVLAMEPDLPDTRKMLVRVGKRETMASVARRYGVTVAQIQSWNKTRRRALSPGQRLVLHVPVGKAFADEPRVMPIETVRVSTRGRAAAMRGGIMRVAVSDDDADEPDAAPAKGPARGANATGKATRAGKSGKRLVGNATGKEAGKDAGKTATRVAGRGAKPARADKSVDAAPAKAMASAKSERTQKSSVQARSKGAEKVANNAGSSAKSASKSAGKTAHAAKGQKVASK